MTDKNSPSTKNMILLKRGVSVLLATGALFTSSCAYFNTFYNTKKYYNEALKEYKNRVTEQPSSQEKQKFDKAINQASKVVQLFPESKYVDDSIMIIGRSYYYIEEYRKAERKFEELEEYFPNSVHAPEAKLWLAKSKINLEEYREAETILVEQVAGQQKRFRKQASFWIGESRFKQEKYDEAVVQYEQALGSVDNNELEVQSLMRLGRCYSELDDYSKAAEYLARASKRAKKQDTRFQSTLAYGVAVAASGEQFRAKKILKDLVDKDFQNKEIYHAKLELAHVYLATGEDGKALELYNDIIDDHPRTEGAAGAYFALAKYDETMFSNYKAAEENYRHVKRQFAKHELVEEADKRAEHLKMLVGLQEEVVNFRKALTKLEEWHENAANPDVAEENTTAVEDTAKSAARPPKKTEMIEVVLNEEEIAEFENETKREPRFKTARASQRDQKNRNSSTANNQRNFNNRQDPRSQRNLGQAEQNRLANENNRRNSPNSRDRRTKPRKKTIKVRPGDSDSLHALISQKNFEMAELFLFEFEIPDSALNLYLDVLTTSEVAEERAFSFYSLAYIYEHEFPNEAVRDSIYQILTLNYPDTEHGRKAAVKLGLVESESDTLVKTSPRIDGALQSAYDALFSEEQPETAITRFENALESPQPDSVNQRLLYTLGWIHENKLKDNEKAFDYYERLAQDFPRSQYAGEIKSKVEYVKQQRKAVADSLAKLEAAAKADSLAAANPALADSAAIEASEVQSDSLGGDAGMTRPLDVEEEEQAARIQQLLERNSKTSRFDSLKNRALKRSSGGERGRGTKADSTKSDSTKTKPDRKPAEKEKAEKKS